MPGLGGLPSVASLFPLKIIIGTEDVTPYVANGITFSNIDPGGYEMSSFPIPRDLPNTLRGQYLRIDCGLKVAWEGRISEVERSLGNTTTITGEGYGALFKDNTMAQIFIDQDLTQWQGPTIGRQLELVVDGYSPSSAAVSSDPSDGNPSLALTGTGPWTTNGWVDCEALYDAQGIPIASVAYNVTFGANLSGLGFNVYVYLVTSDLITSGDQVDLTSSASGTLTASSNTRPYASIVMFGPSSAGGAANVLYAAYVDNLAVYGNHGLTNRGGGFYPSDIATYVASQVQGLHLGNILADTGYVLPQSVYLTPVTMDQIINDMAVAGGDHWGVWESFSPLTGNPLPRFDFCPRPTQGQFTAFCHRSDCDKVDVKEDLSGQYNYASVNYTDVAGVSRSVLVYLDNPILDAAGIESRTVVFSGGLMTEAVAKVFGLEALDLLYSQDRVGGTIEISGMIDGPSGPTAPWLLKAGIDRIRVGDLPSVDAFGIYNDVPISRVECTAGENGISTTLELGSGGNLTETLQARLTAASTLAGQGGV
jgi:hypothetical protein